MSSFEQVVSTTPPLHTNSASTASYILRISRRIGTQGEKSCVQVVQLGHTEENDITMGDIDDEEPRGEQIAERTTKCNMGKHTIRNYAGLVRDVTNRANEETTREARS